MGQFATGVGPDTAIAVLTSLEQLQTLDLSSKVAVLRRLLLYKISVHFERTDDTDTSFAQLQTLDLSGEC